MNGYANIICAVITPRDLSSKEGGSSVIDLLESYQWARPTHVGNCEPISEPYSDPSSALKHWSDPFLWQNLNNGLEGSVWLGRGVKHTCLYMNLNANTKSQMDQDAWLTFIRTACCTLRPDLSYLHLTTNRELEDSRIPYDYTYAIDRGLTTHDLEKG